MDKKNMISEYWVSNIKQLCVNIFYVGIWGTIIKYHIDIGNTSFAYVILGAGLMYATIYLGTSENFAKFAKIIGI